MIDQYSSIQLFLSEEELLAKLLRIKAWVFDWDGIFNDGHKGVDKNNSFCERDSMATNMMRFAHYLRTQEQAYCAIITGASNQAPKNFAEREHFHAVVPGAMYKRDVVENLLESWEVKAEETAFFFDDILDLNVCEIAGLRIQVQYPSSISLNQFVANRKLVDVLTTTSGQHQAVRTILDYFVNLLGQAEEVIEGRMHVNNTYQTYFNARQDIQTKVFSRAELLNL